MNEKIERAVKLIEKGYKPVYEKHIKAIPALHTSSITLESPFGGMEKIDFEGMEVSAADSLFINYLKNEQQADSE